MIQILFKKWRKEFLFTCVMTATLWYFILFLFACLLHVKHSLAMGYTLIQVEDVIHFFLVIEIVTFVSSLTVTMIVLLFASCRNDKQLLP